MNLYVQLLSVVILGNCLACGTVESSNPAVPVQERASTESLPASKDRQIAVFAGGCFWGVEAVFESIKGVSDVKSGYSGGTAKTANYDEVSDGTTAHAEAVQITFDPAVVSYEQLLEVFFKVAHDPTELNRQGPDTGPQYRSAIFFTNDEQKRLTQNYIEKLGAAKTYPKPIVTQVVALEKFYDAEAYHQDYLPQNLDSPYIIAHDLPKLENLKKQFPALYVKK
ncbi:MAG: peptide-methionine (S)-S-oxide reductase MsrA [Saprospiraceae bacterium]|nr:peptide-methionine (S)-S-oxide reductase MsrA [Pyrinomonadaceae bacterium]